MMLGIEICYLFFFFLIVITSSSNHGKIKLMQNLQLPVLFPSFLFVKFSVLSLLLMKNRDYKTSFFLLLVYTIKVYSRSISHQLISKITRCKKPLCIDNMSNISSSSTINFALLNQAINRYVPIPFLFFGTIGNILNTSNATRTLLTPLLKGKQCDTNKMIGLQRSNAIDLPVFI